MSDDGRVDLADFLLARIAEDEAAARAAAVGPWTYSDIESVAGGSLYDPSVMIASIHWDTVGENPEPIHRFRSSAQADGTGEHIARWDPARVLAECGAKLRVVEAHHSDGHEYQLCVMCNANGPQAQVYPCVTLMLLALPYADHPDYDEAWRP